MTITLDDSEMKRRIAAISSRAATARNASLAAGMGHAVEHLIVEWPKDTHASVVSWQNAANMAGLGPFPVDEIRPSREAEQIEARLRKQLDYWQVNTEALEGLAQKRLEEYAANPPRGKRGRRRKMNLPERWPSYRKTVKQRDRALRELAKFLNNEGRVVAIYGKSNKRHNDYLASTLTTVRTNLGLGEGRRFEINGTLFIELANKSPHARIIDRRNRAVARARARLRARGIEIVRTSYLRELLAGEGRAAA
jgi:hypothetical protein